MSWAGGWAGTGQGSGGHGIAGTGGVGLANHSINNNNCD